MSRLYQPEPRTEFWPEDSVRVIQAGGWSVVLRKGDRFGCLTLTSCGKRLFAQDGIEDRLDWMELTCLCGKTIALWASRFPGKRKLKDCGCGRSSRDHSYVVVGVSLPLETREDVERFRQAEGLSFSRAIVELVRRGLPRKPSR